MKRRSPLPRPLHRTAVATTSTGEHCPETGWWIPQGRTEPWRYLSEGGMMPALNGQPAVWLRAKHRQNARTAGGPGAHPKPLPCLNGTVGGLCDAMEEGLTERLHSPSFGH